MDDLFGLSEGLDTGPNSQILLQSSVVFCVGIDMQNWLVKLARLSLCFLK